MQGRSSQRPEEVRVQGDVLLRDVQLLNPRQVLDARSAALTRDLMGLVVTYGTGGASRGAAAGGE